MIAERSWILSITAPNFSFMFRRRCYPRKNDRRSSHWCNSSILHHFIWSIKMKSKRWDVILVAYQHVPVNLTATYLSASFSIQYLIRYQIFALESLCSFQIHRSLFPALQLYFNKLYTQKKQRSLTVVSGIVIWRAR